jgi:hypothetical protein
MFDDVGEMIKAVKERQRDVPFWHNEFVDSCVKRYDSLGQLSDRQIEVLEGICERENIRSRRLGPCKLPWEKT